MGWFTNRSKGWELANLWFLPLSIVIPKFFIFAFLYIGYRGKIFAWFFLSFVYIQLGIWSAEYNGESPFAPYLVYIIWITGVIVLLAVSPIFLKRLDNSKRQPIYYDLGMEFDYIISIFFGAKKNHISSNNDARLRVDLFFIANLKHWKKEIESHIIQNNIDRMIEIAIIIYQKDSAASNVFFARHADTIDKMLQQYNEIEDSALDTPVIQESKEHIISVIETARKAFEQELTNMFKSEILNTRAESDAYLQNLRDRGLIE